MMCLHFIMLKKELQNLFAHFELLNLIYKTLSSSFFFLHKLIKLNKFTGNYPIKTEDGMLLQPQLKEG